MCLAFALENTMARVYSIKMEIRRAGAKRRFMEDEMVSGN